MVKRILAITPKTKLVTVNRDKLAIVAKEFNLSRYETVAEFLASDHHMNWQNATSQVLLDQYYKCDVLVCFKGYHISIDVTTDKNKCRDKQRHIQSMSVAYEKLGIDKQVVLLVKGQFDANTLEQMLNNVIRSKEVTIQVI